MVIKIIEENIDISNLRNEVKKLFHHPPVRSDLLNKGKESILLQSDIENVDIWVDGSTRDRSASKMIDTEFVHILPFIKDTELAKFITKYKAFRTRIMMIKSRKCYPVHADKNPRIHIPLMTNDHSWMVWPEENQVHHLKPGNVYWTDTTKKHTAFNGALSEPGDVDSPYYSAGPRIHLVMSVSEIY